MSQDKMVRIGCSSAFWGDSPTAAAQLVYLGGHLDYLVNDYLAEVTMCILARSKKNKLTSNMGEGGYVKEYVETVWKPLMKEIMKKKIKLITNAGGLNPLGLKEAIEKAARDAGVEVPVVAAITGDDLINSVDQLKKNNSIKNFAVDGETEELWNDKVPVVSFNAYLGAFPIAKALADGAQIVVTGRCVDSALVLGPLIHEFQWKADQYDLLSAGSLAGHIIECGCQATGGNFTDWEQSYSRGWDNVGFPIVECNRDGSFLVTKPEGTGGIVTRFTVAEQMLYEIGDPANYALPDVFCDWRDVTIEDVEENKVRVKGAKGRPASGFYKVSVTALHGYRLAASLNIGGVDAARKARAVGMAILDKSRRLFKMRKLPDFLETNIEILGAEHTYGPHSAVSHTREVVLRLSAAHVQPEALGIVARELAPAATGMAPGIYGGGDGRPNPSPVMKFYSCLIPKEAVDIKITVGSKDSSFKDIIPSNPSAANPPVIVNTPTQLKEEPKKEFSVEVPLIALCCGRSGDKGDVANIGLVARDASLVPIIRQAITEQAVSDYMGHLIRGHVRRYELPGIGGFNFLLTKSLGGGGVSSLRVDRQGKAYAQMLLTKKVAIPQSLYQQLLKNKTPYVQAKL